jgi:hypothetical protein
VTGTATMRALMVSSAPPMCKEGGGARPGREDEMDTGSQME